MALVLSEFFDCKRGPVTVYQNEQGVWLVRADDLYSALEVAHKRFAIWIRYRMRQFRLRWGKDYVIQKVRRSKSRVGRPSNDYFLTAEAAIKIVEYDRGPNAVAIRAQLRSCIGTEQ